MKKNAYFLSKIVAGLYGVNVTKPHMVNHTKDLDWKNKKRESGHMLHIINMFSNFMHII
jgi:hypothetical protein